MHHIVLLDADTLHGVDLSQLQLPGCTLQLYPSTTAAELPARLQHATVVISNKVLLDAAMLAQAPLLKLICVAATGTNNVDLAAATDLGILAEEGRISVEQWREGCASGEITETFACGTAAVITPVGSVKSRTSGSWEIGSGGLGEVSMRLRQALLDIQTGAAPDRHNWLHTIC